MKTTIKHFRQLLIVVLLLCLPSLAQDLNGDGEINGSDCQYLLKMINSGSTKTSLDVNKDNTVDLKDALFFGQWVNGLWNNPGNGYTTLYSTNPGDTVAYNNYRKNLAARKNSWSISELKKAYPDNTIKTDLNYDSSEVAFCKEVSAFFKEPEYMNWVLKKGVAVNSKAIYPNFFSAFDIIHTNDLPVIFTTDAMLQTIYRSYDNILKQLETNSFIPSLKSILSSSITYLDKVYTATDYTNDVRTYLLTALMLLSPQTNLNAGSEVNSLISAIKNEQMQKITLFGRDKMVDFSQFKPRGHYTKSQELSNYFKAMMWLGRADLAFEIGGATTEDLSRMKKGALVTWDCVVNSGTLPQWLEFNRIIEYMVGNSDGLTIKGMGNLVHDMGNIDIPDFVAHFNENKFDSAMVAGAYGLQSILSEYMEVNGFKDSLELSRIFNFFPQRFIIDSYTMSQLVYPFTARSLPSSLDIAFVLGDNTALDDHPEMKGFVPGILGSQRQLYDEISPKGWQSNMYCSWINFLRQLKGVENNNLVAPVFRTHTWATKMRNTQLTSWAHLRHNTLLYAKQSYTASITCSHPTAYVEPYPEFFHAVTAYANKGEMLFKEHDTQISGFFKSVSQISTDLARIAELTARGAEPTPEQISWLRSIVSSHQVGGDGYNQAYKVYDGWYFDLVYDNNSDNKKEGWISFSTIADVHTKPADDTGPALVLHGATGYINLMTVAVEIDSCTTLFVGPVGSYYDVTTSAGSPQRIDDEQWESELSKNKRGMQSIVERPSWCSEFLY